MWLTRPQSDLPPSSSPKFFPCPKLCEPINTNQGKVMKEFIIKTTKSFMIAGITLSTLSACINVPSIEKSSPLLGAYLQGSDLLQSDFMAADSIEFNLSETLRPSLEFVETLDFSWFEESVQWTTSTANELLDFETPDVSLPTVHLPNLEFPEIKLSKIPLPDVSLQDINLLGSA